MARVRTIVGTAFTRQDTEAPVAPDRQRQRVGTALMYAILGAAEALGELP